MLKTRTLKLLILVLLLFPISVRAGGGHDHDHDHGDESRGHHEQKDRARGVHGGRLFEENGFGLELTIFEQGVSPQFRVYPFFEDQPISPEQVKLTITLERFLRAAEEFRFVPHHDYLTSIRIVHEPHSFGVRLQAQYEGKSYNWEFETHEGRTEFSEEALKVANLELSVAGPKEIANTARVYGRLLPNENKVAHVYPRFEGVILAISKDLGDSVKQGEVLAVVESNQSLRPYEIRSNVAGVVTKRHATLGAFVSNSREIFVVTDLSEVWADFQVYRDDFGAITAGHQISVDLGNTSELPATVAYVSPLTDETTQSKLVRAILPNPSQDLRPGLFVSGVLSKPDTEVPVAVKREAIQTFRDWNVVYITDGHTFQAMPVELGRRDSKYVEVISGLEAGDRYVSGNSFVVKADIEKSGASHDH